VEPTRDPSHGQQSRREGISSLPSQHKESKRFTPEELLSTMAIDASQVERPRPSVILFDDVITMGASFRAMKQLIMQQLGVTKCYGVFLARTVWPNPFEPPIAWTF
jgi:predicted amidophosphoribosyltransferase